MDTLKRILIKFESLKGSKFVGLKNFENKDGERSNIVLIANISVLNAKKRDLEKLESLTDQDLQSIHIDKNLPLETLQIALTELIDSAKTNLAKEVEKRNAHSQGQTNKHFKIVNSVYVNKKSENIAIKGFLHSKTILDEGAKKERKQAVKTMCKDAIKEYCDLSMLKYREYHIGSIDRINVSGDTITIVK